MSSITANVVVFIPPPVLHGDEPINIIIAEFTMPAGDSNVWSKDEYPAVELAVTAWNMLLSSFSPPLSPLIAAELNSDARKKNVPTVIIVSDTTSTALVWKR